MLERIVISTVLVGTAVAAYQLLLLTQRRWAMAGSKREAHTDRSALLVFTSPTCAPCKLQQMPIVERLMADWRDQIDVDVVDVSERPEIAAHLRRGVVGADDHRAGCAAQRHGDQSGRGQRAQAARAV